MTSSVHAAVLRAARTPLAVSALARKVGPPDAGLRWDLAASDVASGSYPKPG